MDVKNFKKVNRLSLKDQIYQELKQAIITLELQPGTKINDKTLAEEFGVSRTPVREAIKRLEDEGLIESFPGSITRVTTLNEQEAKDAFPVAAALHALAARLAIPHLTSVDIEKLKHYNHLISLALEKNDFMNAIEADQLFHQIFIGGSMNQEIEYALDRITPKIDRLIQAKFSSLRGLTSVEQHQEIINACMVRDPNQVSKLVEENWLSLGDLIITTFN